MTNPYERAARASKVAKIVSLLRRSGITSAKAHLISADEWNAIAFSLQVGVPSETTKKEILEQLEFAERPLREMTEAEMERLFA